MIVFDIETGPLDRETICRAMPPFDAEAVKVGNIKDPEKINAKIKEACDNYYQRAIDEAALSPLTGQVVAIGYLGVNEAPDPPRIAGAFREDRGGYTEEQMLGEFWKVYAWCKQEGKRLVGFNSNSFDLPFLVRRSWMLGVLVPPNLLYNNRYFNAPLVDLREVWACGEYQSRGSLDSICKACGLGEKNGDGKDFARLWDEDPSQALAYLNNDLQMTSRLALRMGVG